MMNGRNMRKIIIGLAMAAALVAALFAIPSTAQDQVARRHSCGYHCNPDGSPATPAAPPIQQDVNNDGIIDGTIQTVGRTNPHSGGRLHGSANKRVGCGGCAGNPASNIMVGNSVGIQLMGRTNVHSGGRAGGKAQPRTGSGADRRSIGWVSYQPGDDVMTVTPVIHSSKDGSYTKRRGFGCGNRHC